MSPFSPVAILRDPVSDEQLRREGYVVIDLVAANDVERLLELCMDLHPAPSAIWESDFYSTSADVKRQVHEAIGSALRPGLATAFTGHRSLIHNFILNWPGDEGGLVLHQHSSLVDERRYRSVFAWCALTPASEANGTLHVVPRSHLIQRGPRPEHSPSWADEHQDQLLREHLVSVPVQPGQALIFDNQLLHCSFPNTTDEPRITAGATVLPTAADPLYFESAPDGNVEVYQLDPDFFIDHVATFGSWARPEGLELLDVIDWSPTVVAADDLRRVFAIGTCSHGTAAT